MFAAEMPDRDQVDRLNTFFNGLETSLMATALPLDDAFDLAIELEASEIDEVYRRLTAPIDGPAHILRKKMELLADRHLERLADAAERFGASQAIQARLGTLLSPTGGL